MSPAVRRRRPSTRLKSVLLPAPLCPRSARVSPRSIVSDTSSRARRAPNDFETPSNASTRLLCEGADRFAADFGLALRDVPVEGLRAAAVGEHETDASLDVAFARDLGVAAERVVRAGSFAA